MRGSKINSSHPTVVGTWEPLVQASRNLFVMRLQFPRFLIVNYLVLWDGKTITLFGSSWNPWAVGSSLLWPLTPMSHIDHLHYFTKVAAYTLFLKTDPEIEHQQILRSSDRPIKQIKDFWSHSYKVTQVQIWLSEAHVWASVFFKASWIAFLMANLGHLCQQPVDRCGWATYWACWS